MAVRTPESPTSHSTPPPTHLNPLSVNGRQRPWALTRRIGNDSLLQALGCRDHNQAVGEHVIGSAVEGLLTVLPLVGIDRPLRCSLLLAVLRVN